MGADLDELLRIVVLGLEWFALRLEGSPLHVAWPLCAPIASLANYRAVPYWTTCISIPDYLV